MAALRYMDGDKNLEDIAMQVNDNNEEWRDNKSLADCAKHLSDTKVLSDVNFNFKKYGDQKLQAHRLILSMRSAIFEAMFFGPMAANQDDIDIEDIEPDIFELVLGYIYTDETELNGDTVLKCLYAARKYCLNGLVKLCSDFLENSISVDNVCTLYEQAKFFGVKELTEKCYTFIIDKAVEVVVNEDIEKLPYDSLLQILSDEDLPSEEFLNFKMAEQWALNKCETENLEPSGENKRNALGDILTKIRFPVMPPEAFAKDVVPTKVLPAEEQVQILQFMVTRATETPGSVGRFISLPRHGINLVVNLLNVGYFKTSTGTSNILKLVSSHTVALSSIKGFTGNFRNIRLICEEDQSCNRSFKGSDFEILNKELFVKKERKGEICFPANKACTLTYDNNYGGFSQQFSSRLLNHVETFGEISITVTQVPGGIMGLSFCRV